MKGLVSKETVEPSRWGSEMGKFVIKQVDILTPCGYPLFLTFLKDCTGFLLADNFLFTSHFLNPCKGRIIKL